MVATEVQNWEKSGGMCEKGRKIILGTKLFSLGHLQKVNPNLLLNTSYASVLVV